VPASLARGDAASPSWTSACALANACRRTGDPEAAATAFMEAARLDVSDVAAFLDAGDIWLNAERWASALEAYQGALRREPGQPWAKPSACYCEYRQSGDRRHLRRLRAMASARPDPCGIADFLSQTFGGFSPEDQRRRATELQGAASSPIAGSQRSRFIGLQSGTTKKQRHRPLRCPNLLGR